jgi:hypothetical protein
LHPGPGGNPWLGVWRRNGREGRMYISVGAVLAIILVIVLLVWIF